MRKEGLHCLFSSLRSEIKALCEWEGVWYLRNTFLIMILSLGCLAVFIRLSEWPQVLQDSVKQCSIKAWAGSRYFAAQGKEEGCVLHHMLHGCIQSKIGLWLPVFASQRL